MKKYICIVLGLMVCAVLTFIPFECIIEKDASREIEEDSLRNREIAVHQLDSIFGGFGGGFGCVLYYNILPNYKLVPNTERIKYFPNRELNKLDRLSELNTLYVLSSDVEEELNNLDCTSLLNSIWLANIDRGGKGIKPLDGRKTRQEETVWQSGWLIGYAIRNSEDSYSYFFVYPRTVGYIGTEHVDDIEISNQIENVLDFFVHNKKSFVNGSILDENIHKFWELVNRNNLGARLYSFEEDSTKRFIGGINDCISNSNRRVFIRSTKSRTYTLEYCNEYDEAYRQKYVSEHRSGLIQILSVIVGILVIILIVLLCAYHYERKKRNLTTIEKILYLSNPKRFMKKYDGKKVEMANNIYKKAMSINQSDESAILELCDQIERELEINIIEEAELKSLKKDSNPKNFTNPYNAEKLEKANKIYERLRKGNLSYREFVVLKDEVKSLYA